MNLEMYLLWISGVIITMSPMRVLREVEILVSTPN